MFVRRVLLGAAASLALCGFAVADETVIFTGVVTGGFDTLDIFGATAPIGASYTLTFHVYDLPSDTIDGHVQYSQIFSPPAESEVFGTGFGDGSSPVDASLTIDGVTFDDGDFYTGGGASRSTAASGQSEVLYSSNDDSGNVNLLIDQLVESTVDPFVTNYDYRAPLYHLVTVDDAAAGGFSIVRDFDGVDETELQLTPTSVDVIGTPEPGTWVLMITGLIGVGAELRRRQPRANPCLKMDGAEAI